MRITPAEVFWTRRRLIARLGQGAVATAVGAGLGACSGRREIPLEPLESLTAPATDHRIPDAVERRAVTAQEVAASHTNFYELGPGKARDFRGRLEAFDTVNWQVVVDGLCERPTTLTVDDLKQFPLEERLYHFRCVERWAMNVPWVGFPLHRLWEKVRPRPEARWVVFESAALGDELMPGIAQAPHYPWPYREALRRDEADHDLAFLALGAYGEVLPPQHGAPVRLVVPWKYGYKSAKSIVRITWVDEEPTTFWHQVSPHEYGLLSNVNPNISHPRWEQKLSFWLRDDPVWPTGEDVFPTPIFNGYGSEVAHLYPDEPRLPLPPLQPGEIAR